MQPLTGAPRDHLDPADIITLIEADDLTVTRVGCHLVDDAGDETDDLTDVLRPDGSTVEHDRGQAVHGRCTLQLTDDLVWGRDQVQLHMLLSGAGHTDVRVDLGRWLLQTPDRHGGRTPAVRQVRGYDLLHLLDVPAGRTVTVARDEPIVATVADLLEQAGAPGTLITSSGDDVPLPERRTWPLTDASSWLQICNDLLRIAGWAPLWADWRGRLRTDPARDPADRSAQWRYSTVSPTSTLAPDGQLTDDRAEIPNRWVFYAGARSHNPVDGDGLHVVDNLDDGPTSQQALGRIVTDVASLDVHSHTQLVTEAERVADETRRVTRTAQVNVGLNPLHWHDDLIRIDDPHLQMSGRWEVDSWRLPLGAGLMQLSCRQVAR